MATPDHTDDQIAAYIVSQVAGLSYNTQTSADNVWTGRIPDSDFNGIVVLTAPSGEQTPFSDLKNLTIDIWSRNASALNNKTLMENIHGAIHRLANTNLGNYDIYIIKAQTAPEGDALPVDPNDNDLRKASFKVMYRKLP